MRLFSSLACLTLALTLSACGNPSGGYYDRNGNFVATDTPHNVAKGSHSPAPGYRPYHDEEGDYNNPYDRRGYYNRAGYYDMMEGGVTVPEDMFPPRGMCRVWFMDRAPANQPRIESCDGIRSRVPAGAYVIYGG